MPELPEVEACRQLASKYCSGKTIVEAQVAEDDKVIEGIAPVALQEALQGRTIKQAHRKGKHMWLEFDQGPCLMLHFGMTGVLAVKGVKSHQYKNFKVDGSDWPPKFWKVALKLSDDVDLAFLDTRRFARVRLQEDPAEHEPVSLLGFDPVLNMPSLEDFTKLLKVRKTSLKALLLDQAFSAGVGNWVADEVLYQAQLYPEVKASTLTDAEICELHKALKDVPATAVAAEADSEKFPPDWLFHVRWGGPKKSPKVNGHPVEFLKVGGRTTAYVPAVQKPPLQDLSSPKKGKRKAKTEAVSDHESELQQSEEDADTGPMAEPSKRRKQTAAKLKSDPESDPEPVSKPTPESKSRKAAPAKRSAKANQAGTAGKKRRQAAVKDSNEAVADDDEEGEEDGKRPQLPKKAARGKKAVQQQEKDQPKAAAMAGAKAGKKGPRAAAKADPFEMKDSSEDDDAKDEKQQQPRKAAKGKASKKTAQQEEAEQDQPKVATKDAGKGRNR